MLIKRENSHLLVVDIQEKFIPVMFEISRVIENSVILIKAAKILDIPIIISEQYPKGLGTTIDEIAVHVDASSIFPKMHFSCIKNIEISKHFEKTKRNQVVICGIESHVCVLQTALNMKENGFDVFVVADACTSRKQESADTAYRRMREAGISIVNTEMALFEWVEATGSDEFKQISKLIK